MHHASHVAVGDQADGGTGGAHLGDHVGVAGAFEDANGDIRRRAALGAGQCFDPLTGAHVEGDDIGLKARTDGEFVHIGVGRVQHGAARAHGDHSQRVGHVFGGQGGAFERVKRDVHAGAIAGADFLADVKHRGLIPLAFADDYDARDVEHVELLAHSVDGGLVGGFLVTFADQLGRGQRGGFGNAGEAEREHAVLKFGGSGHGISLGSDGFSVLYPRAGLGASFGLCAGSTWPGKKPQAAGRHAKGVPYYKGAPLVRPGRRFGDARCALAKRRSRTHYKVARSTVSSPTRGQAMTLRPLRSAAPRARPRARPSCPYSPAPRSAHRGWSYA